MSVLTRTAISAFPFLVTGRLLDRIPEIGDPLGCAFSIRRVYTNYTGPGVRIRRSSDGAEKDIGFIQTRLDTDALLEFCNGFDGYVRTWYDQTGQGRHAEQTEWENQPRLVREGSLIVDTEQNLTIEFNNAFLSTEWEPDFTPPNTETGEAGKEMSNGGGMMIVGSSGNGIQGQTGLVSIGTTAEGISNIMPPYPELELPSGQDKYYLESVPLVDGSVRVSLFVDKNKQFSMILPDTSPASVVSTGKPVTGGPTVLTATVMEAENDFGQDAFGEDNVDARANAPITETAWSHAVEGANGKIYGIPSGAQYVLEIDPTQDPPVSKLVGTQTLGSGADKWKRGVLVGNYIYASPFNSTDILRIQTTSGQDAVVETKSAGLTTEASYFGIVAIPSENGDVFCIPHNAGAVLRIGNTQEPIADVTVNVIALPYAGNISYKWSDGVYAQRNGRIYGMPWDAGAFLEIDPSSGTAGYVGSTGMRLSIPNYSNRTSNRQNPALCGEGYYTKPVITLDYPNPSDESDGERATVNTEDTSIQYTKVVTQIPISDGGYGYISTPTLRLIHGVRTAQRQIDASVVLEDVSDVEGKSLGKRVAGISISDHGRGYSTSPPGVVIEGGKGADAVIRAIVDTESDLKKIIAFEIANDGGSGYFDLDDVTVTVGSPGNNGQQAQINNADLEWELVDETDPSLGYRLAGIRKFTAGTNYERAPAVNVRGGHGDFASPDNPVLVQDAHLHDPTLSASTANGYAEQEAEQYYTNPNWVDFFEVSDVDANGNRVFYGNDDENAVFYIEEVDANGKITIVGTVDSGRGYIVGDSLGPPIVRLIRDPTGNVLDSPIPVTVSVRPHGYLDNVQLSNEGSGYINTLSTTDDTIQIGNNNALRIGGTSARLVTEFIDEDVGLNYTGYRLGNEKYIGAVYSEITNEEDGAITAATITAAPRNAVRPFRMNVPASGSASVERGTFAFNQYDKFRDIVLDGDRKNAYCIPYNESRVLRINLATGGDTLFGSFGGRWSSGAYSSLSGVIYGFPADSSSVLIIDPKQNIMSQMVSYGNLEVERTKFSSAVSVRNNDGYNGIVYAIPDRVDFSMEMNPGAPAKSISLPPPWTVVKLADNTYKVIVAPTPTYPNITVHTVDLALQPPEITKTDVIPVVPQPSKPNSFPWFGECIAIPTATTVVFVPFYNQNSNLDYVGFVLLFNYALEPPDDPSEPSQYIWTRLEVQYQWAPPSPSRCAIAMPVGSSVSEIWWTPKVSLETMLRFVLPTGVDPTTPILSDSTEKLKFGDTSDAFRNDSGENSRPEANRPVKSISWATTGIGTNPTGTGSSDTAVVTFPVDSRTYFAGYDNIETRESRRRNSRGCLAKNGKIYTFPFWGSTTVRSYDTNDEFGPVKTIVDLGVGETGEVAESGTGDLRGLENSFSFYHAIYVPSTNEVYGIPNVAYDIFVYSIDNSTDVTPSIFRFGRKQLEDEGNQTLPNAGRREDYESKFPEFKAAVLLPDSRIVCISSSLKRIVVIDPTIENYLERFLFVDMPPLGDVALGDVPYIDAIVVGEYAYFMPYDANKILRYHAPTDTVDFTGPFLNITESNELWWGQPTYHPNGSIYVPQTRNATIVKVPLDPTDGSVDSRRVLAEGETGNLVEFIPTNVDQPCIGASTGNDNMLYFSSERWRAILTMNPYSNECVYLEPNNPLTGEVWEHWVDPPYDIETFRTDYTKDNARGRSTFEGEENSVNMIKAQDGRVFVVPETRRVYQVLYPAAKVIGNYNVSSSLGSFEPAGYTSREYRNRPFVLEKEIDTITKKFTLFHTDDGYSVYDAETKSTAFGPTFENGLTSLFVTPNSTELISFGNTNTATVKPFAGTIAGVKSSNDKSDLYSVINEGDYTFHIGNGDLTTLGVFGVIFSRDLNNVQTPGVFGSMTSVSGSSGTITNYIRGISLGRALYQSDGKPGKTFQIGQVEGVNSEGKLVFVSRFTGNLSEVITFQSDQVSRSRELFRDQNFAYNI